MFNLPIFWDEVEAESFVDAFSDSFDATPKSKRFSRNDFAGGLSNEKKKVLIVFSDS